MEPDETKNDAHGFGYTFVVGKRHGLVQRDFDDLDKLPLAGLASTGTHAVVVGHLRVKHCLLRTRYTHAWPVEGKRNENLYFYLFMFKSNKTVQVLLISFNLKMKKRLILTICMQYLTTISQSKHKKGEIE